jgi:hypothetical protein
MDGGSLLQNLASPERTRGPRGCGERLAAVHPDTTSPASRVKHTHRDTHTVSQALLTAPRGRMPHQCSLRGSGTTPRIIKAIATMWRIQPVFCISAPWHPGCSLLSLSSGWSPSSAEG